jgi:DNA polymerase
MDIVTIDFETYYDKTYSLSKMTTESYIRDPRFEIIGVGVKINNYATDWYSGENFGRVLTGLDYSDKAILAHNAAFDGAILSWKFGIKPKLWLDTLSMARAKVGLIQSISLANLVNAFGLGAKGVEVVNALGKRRAEFTPNELSKYGDYCINDVELTYWPRTTPPVNSPPSTQP